MPNLFVSYDLIAPNKNYAAVEAAIKQCGLAVRVLESVWYVKSTSDLESVRNHIAQFIDGNDKLLVINASSACGQNIGSPWDIVVNTWSK